ARIAEVDGAGGVGADVVVVDAVVCGSGPADIDAVPVVAGDDVAILHAGRADVVEVRQDVDAVVAVAQVDGAGGGGADEIAPDKVPSGPEKNPFARKAIDTPPLNAAEPAADV